MAIPALAVLFYYLLRWLNWRLNGVKSYYVEKKKKKKKKLRLLLAEFPWLNCVGFLFAVTAPQARD